MKFTGEQGVQVIGICIAGLVLTALMAFLLKYKSLEMGCLG